MKVIALEKQYLLRCVSLALIIRHATSIYRIMMPFVACLTVPHLSTFFHNGTIFGENVFNVKKNVCCKFVYIFFETRLILRRTERDMIINVQRSSCEMFLSNCEMREKTNKMQQMFIFNNISTCFGHHYAHLQENKTYYCMWCATLVLLDVVGSGCGALPCGVRAL